MIPNANDYEQIQRRYRSADDLGFRFHDEDDPRAWLSWYEDEVGDLVVDPEQEVIR